MKEQCVNTQALPCQLILEVPLLLGATTLSEQGQDLWKPVEAGPLTQVLSGPLRPDCSPIRS